jgi:hypothetical protein
MKTQFLFIALAAVFAAVIGLSVAACGGGGGGGIINPPGGKESDPFEGSWHTGAPHNETFTFDAELMTFTKIKDQGWGERGDWTCTATHFTTTLTDTTEDGGGTWTPCEAKVETRPYRFEGDTTLIIHGNVVYEKISFDPGTGGKANYRILAIGNSYSRDAMSYIRDMLIKNGVANEDIAIVNAYVGGQSLQGHVSNAKNNTAAYERQSFGINGVLKSTNGEKLLDIIKSNDWDYITLQQVSTDSGRPDTYTENGNLSYLINYIKENATNPNVKIGWHMTWAYANSYSGLSGYGNQMAMYNAIANAVQTKIVPQLAPAGDFEFIIPSGTAIQNARTVYNDTLNSDGTHLTDKGRFIAGAIWLRRIYGKSVDVFNTGYTPAGLSAEDIAKIAQCVQDAFEHPYAVTER